MTRYLPLLALAMLPVVGFFSIDFAAGMASLSAVVVSILSLIAMRANSPARHLTLAWVVLGLVALGLVLVLAYLYSAAFILIGVAKVPAWLAVVGIILECVGLSAAAYFSMTFLRPMEGSTPSRAAMILTISVALLPLLVVLGSPDPGLAASVNFYRQPAAAAALILLGALIGLGYIVGANRIQPKLYEVSIRYATVLKAIVAVACVLPIAYTALSLRLFVHGGIPTALRQYSGYKADLYPVSGERDAFKLVEHYTVGSGNTANTVDSRPVRLAGKPDGFLVHIVHFAPKRGDYSRVTATITVHDLPVGSIREIDFRTSPSDASKRIPPTPFDGKEDVSWTMKSFAEGFTFTYTPPLPALIRPVLSPFIGLASIGAWSFTIAFILFSALTIKAGNALGDYAIDLIKRLLHAKRPGPHPTGLSSSS